MSLLCWWHQTQLCLKCTLFFLSSLHNLVLSLPFAIHISSEKGSRHVILHSTPSIFKIEFDPDSILWFRQNILPSSWLELYWLGLSLINVLTYTSLCTGNVRCMIWKWFCVNTIFWLEISKFNFYYQNCGSPYFYV